MRLPEEDLVAISRYAAYVREKGEARTPGLTPNLSPGSG